MNAKPTSVLIIAHYPLMRVALQTALEAEPDMHVAAQTGSGESGLALYNELQPDLVLIDLFMLGMDGLEVIQHMLVSDAKAHILVIANQENQTDAQATIQAGAMGYFPKTAPRRSLLAAVRTVAKGQRYLPTNGLEKPFSVRVDLPAK